MPTPVIRKALEGARHRLESNPVVEVGGYDDWATEMKKMRSIAAAARVSKPVFVLPENERDKC